jgi:hypothetical protein
VVFRQLQRHPHLLELAYGATRHLLWPFRRALTSESFLGRLLVPLEIIGKGLIFDCRMCGQCVLHSTGMTCPMTCPKNLRNGPCGGVRPNGNCEVVPDMPCVWVQAWERSKRMPQHGREILRVLPPLDRRLQGGSAWINDLNGVARQVPPEWDS